jgi:hypothetical protein
MSTLAKRFTTSAVGAGTGAAAEVVSLRGEGQLLNPVTLLKDHSDSAAVLQALLVQEAWASGGWWPAGLRA